MPAKRNLKTNFSLLKKMCTTHAPSGNEGRMTDLVLNYIQKEKHNWKVQPKIYSGEKWQDCIILVFGEPRTAVFAHLDSIGFTVRYQKQLVKIGGPRVSAGFQLVNSEGKEAELVVKENKQTDQTELYYASKHRLHTGDELTFKPNWRETKDYVQCCYMDNRLGVFNALMLAQTLENGAIVFSCYEEHGGEQFLFCRDFFIVNTRYRRP